MAVKIEIPENLDIKRDLRSPLRHTDNKKLNSKDLAQYDYQTVIYDVFFNVENSVLYLIGPPLLNLKKILLPLRISLNGIQVKVKHKEYFKKHYVLFNADVSKLIINQSNILRINFNDIFEQDVQVSKNLAKKSKFILTTLQKNNKVIWIKHWIEYYKKFYGVDSVVLYDNGSDNVQTLTEQLPDIVIENWDYKHGIVTSHDNKFCQYGSLNHCRLKYGAESVIFNFDIDEILCLPEGKLNQYLYDFDVIRLDSYHVPYFGNEPEGYSFGEFTKRYLNTIKRTKKYIYKNEAVVANNVHYVRKIDNIVLYKLHRELVHFLKSLSKRGVATKILSRLAEHLSKTKEVSPQEGYFLHYLGVTTNWKKGYLNRLNNSISNAEITDIAPAYLGNIRSVSPGLASATETSEKA